jgi:hypothetical protein
LKHLETRPSIPVALLEGAFTGISDGTLSDEEMDRDP